MVALNLSGDAKTRAITMTTSTIEARSPISVAARAAADGLHLAAMPTFAIMALVTRVIGAGPTMMLCQADPSAMNGMVWMYLLMSAFHSVPWLKLISHRRR